MTTQKAPKYRFGIFQKMLLTMLLVAMLPLGTIWYINHQNSLKQISSNINQQLGGISDKLVSHVNSWVTMNFKALKQNASLQDMSSMDAARQNPLLQSMLKEYKWSYLVFTMGTNGMNIGRSDTKAPKNYSDRSYFKQVMQGKPMGKQVIVSRTTGKPALILSAPIYNNDEYSRHQVAGVIAIGMSIKEMSEQITNLKFGKTGFAFMLDERGKVVAHQKSEYANKSADFSKSPAFINRPTSGKKLVTYEDAGRKVVAYIQTTEQGWIMVTQQDYDEAFSSIAEANERAIIILVTTLLIVSLVAYLFSLRLTRPIRMLTHAAEEMSRGKVFQELKETKRKDEIGALALAIERMGASIKLAIERLRTKT